MLMMFSLGQIQIEGNNRDKQSTEEKKKRLKELEELQAELNEKLASSVAGGNDSNAQKNKEKIYC